MPFLNQRKGENDRRNHSMSISTKSMRPICGSNLRLLNLQSDTPSTTLRSPAQSLYARVVYRVSGSLFFLTGMWEVVNEVKSVL